MLRTFVVGDIHGCYNSLESLLEKIEVAEEDYLIFLGDYIDRGPDSEKVISRILEIKSNHPHVITLMGNHEWMFLRYLEGSDKDNFLQAGGKPTLESYGIDPDDEEINPADLIPEDHLKFLYNLLPYYEDPNYIYVHAGLQPGKHLSQQQADWYLWARDQFIYSKHDFGKQVIFGHTTCKRPLVHPNKIGIDTGAVYGGELTCLILPEELFVSVPGIKKTFTDKVRAFFS